MTILTEMSVFLPSNNFDERKGNIVLLSKELTASGVPHSENFLVNACPPKTYNESPVARRQLISSCGGLNKLKHSGQLPRKMSQKGRCQGETIVTREAGTEK